MPLSQILTLNRVIMCKDKDGKMHKVSCFTGSCYSSLVKDGIVYVEYDIVEIHAPKEVKLGRKIRLSFTATSIASRQNM